MTPTDPRTAHALEQFMALHLEVQTMLARHKTALVQSGWTEPEAWALCQRVEERILGPAMDLAETRLRIEDKLDALVAEEIARRRTDRE